MGRLRRSAVRAPEDQGFTLLEMLVVIVMVGVLALIAAPSWFGFLTRQRLTDAQGTIAQGLQQAKLRAEQTSKSWEFAVRQPTGSPAEWAIYPGAVADPTDPSAGVLWEEFHPEVQLNIASGSAEKGAVTTDTYYRTVFDYRGTVGELITYSVNGENSPNTKRCVVVSTLLGATRRTADAGCP